MHDEFEYPRGWRVLAIHYVAKAFGVLVHVRGIPFGSNRNVRRSGGGASGGGGYIGPPATKLISVEYIAGGGPGESDVMRQMP